MGDTASPRAARWVEPRSTAASCPLDSDRPNCLDCYFRAVDLTRWSRCLPATFRQTLTQRCALLPAEQSDSSLTVSLFGPQAERSSLTSARCNELPEYPSWRHPPSVQRAVSPGADTRILLVSRPPTALVLDHVHSFAQLGFVYASGGLFTPSGRSPIRWTPFPFLSATSLAPPRDHAHRPSPNGLSIRNSLVHASASRDEVVAGDNFNTLC